MKTYSAKPGEVKENWHLIDASGMVVGRLAAQIAHILRGKHKPHFTPHTDCGDHVVVINAEKVAFTGKKTSNKNYYRHTGFPGGIKETTPEKILGSRFPHRVVEYAVQRMMPKESPLSRRQFGKLHVYAGQDHKHEAQSPKLLNLKDKNRKNAA